MRPTVRVRGEEAVLLRCGEWRCDNPRVEKLLNDVRYRTPESWSPREGLPGHLRSLVQLLDAEIVSGGDPDEPDPPCSPNYHDLGHIRGEPWVDFVERVAAWRQRERG